MQVATAVKFNSFQASIVPRLLWRNEWRQAR